MMALIGVEKHIAGFPSIQAKTLPPATMGSGWTESVIAKDCIFILNRYESRDVFLRKKWI
jgi:hypothetical protein